MKHYQNDVVATDEGIKLASVSNMLCDKLAILATNKILHRIKDLYDVYTISFVSDIVLCKSYWMSGINHIAMRK